MLVIEDILLSEHDGGVGVERMAVRHIKREVSASRVVKWPKRKYRFQ